MREPECSERPGEQSSLFGELLGGAPPGAGLEQTTATFSRT